jgi:hypothetical protein
VGPGEHTPAHLSDFNDPLFTASTTSPALVMATGATATTTAAVQETARQLQIAATSWSTSPGIGLMGDPGPFFGWRGAFPSR